MKIDPAKMGLKTLRLLLLSVSMLSCAGPQPIEEMALARTALEAAKDAGAATVAPGFWHKAEDHYRKGKQAMKGNYNYEAKDHFVGARAFAEKAENATRLKKFKSGDSFP